MKITEIVLEMNEIAEFMWNNEWRLGTISYISQRVIKFKASEMDISDRMCKGEALRLNSLNQYVYAYLDTSTRVIFKIVEIEERESEYGKEAEIKTYSNYVFTAIPLGEVEKNEYLPGVIEIPMVGSYVYACDPSILNVIFNEGKYGVSLGVLSGYDNVTPKIDIAKFFSTHTAILGNTGSGKSTTARLLLNELVHQLSDSRFRLKAGSSYIVFDLHGDYQDLPSSESVFKLRSDEYHICAGDLTIEDWVSLLSPSQRIQRPLLERALKYSLLNDDGVDKLLAALSYIAISDSNIDSHAARKIQIEKYLNRISDKLESFRQKNSVVTSTVDSLLEQFVLHYGNLSNSVVRQLQSLLIEFVGRRYYSSGLFDVDLLVQECKRDFTDIAIDNIAKALDLVFSEEEVKGNKQARSYSEGLVTQLNNVASKYSANLFNLQNGDNILNYLDKCGLIILDVSSVVDSDGLKLFSNFLSRYMLEKNMANDGKYDSPVCLIFDEAHRYIQESTLLDDSIFNRIAREGRKFGVSLLVISQIPSELSRVVLSQTSTFVIHRIQNSIDLDYLKKNVPAITSNQVDRLPSFAPGTALILGSSVKLPIELQIDGQYKDVTPPISIRA